MVTGKTKRCIVVTTIGYPTDSVISWIEEYSSDWNVIIVADQKTPDDWRSTCVDYLSLDRQHELFSDFSSAAPLNHYSRKNLGYLYAISLGVEVILETDDDNFPVPGFGQSISPRVSGRFVGGEQWVNVYRYFSDKIIWPRGMPLDAIHQRGKILKPVLERDCPVQQFLVNDDPDVDAIWRLVFGSAEVLFDQSADPVIMDAGSWVPFNSQNTIFFRDAFPLLYLPHHVSFRVTDIWRSFVAQAVLWATGKNLAFHAPSARQDRNRHDLMVDFSQEIPGYLSNREICAALIRHMEENGWYSNQPVEEIARRLWHEMVRIGVVPDREILLIEKWYSHLSAIYDAGLHQAVAAR